MFLGCRNNSDENNDCVLLREGDSLPNTCYFKSFSNFKVQILSILQKKKMKLQRSFVIFPKPQAPKFHSRGLIQSDWMSQCEAFPLQGKRTQLEDSNPRGEPSKEEYKIKLSQPSQFRFHA